VEGGRRGSNFGSLPYPPLLEVMTLHGDVLLNAGYDRR
jgi:hypothetical protein